MPKTSRGALDVCVALVLWRNCFQLFSHNFLVALQRFVPFLLGKVRPKAKLHRGVAKHSQVPLFKWPPDLVGFASPSYGVVWRTVWLRWIRALRTNKSHLS